MNEPEKTGRMGEFLMKRLPAGKRWQPFSAATVMWNGSSKTDIEIAISIRVYDAYNAYNQ